LTARLLRVHYPWRTARLIVRTRSGSTAACRVKRNAVAVELVRREDAPGRTQQRRGDRVLVCFRNPLMYRDGQQRLGHLPRRGKALLVERAAKLWYFVDRRRVRRAHSETPTAREPKDPPFLFRRGHGNRQPEVRMRAGR